MFTGLKPGPPACEADGPVDGYAVRLLAEGPRWNNKTSGKYNSKYN
jgi:hypothetical protein